MKIFKSMTKKFVGFVAVKSAKFACGTASTGNFGQPVEPKNLKKYFEK